MPVALPPWSYTAIDAFDNCPHQFYWKYILKNKEPASKEMEDGRRVHEALEKRVAAGIPLPANIAAYEPLAASIARAAPDVEVRTEMKVGVDRELKPCDFFAKNVYGRGALDVARFTPIEKPERAFIGDWKTGKTREKDFQVKVFAFFTFSLYPTVKEITAANIWLPALKVGQKYIFTRGELPAIWSEIYIKLAAMEMAAANDTWVKRQSPLCSWCPVKDCEHNRNKK